VTPLTLQWAAFEKYCCTDTRTVMYSVLFDVEYESLYFYFPFKINLGLPLRSDVAASAEFALSLNLSAAAGESDDSQDFSLY
jgi:hypothetical protein